MEHLKRFLVFLNNFKLHTAALLVKEVEPTSSRNSPASSDAPVEVTSYKVLLAQPCSA